MIRNLKNIATTTARKKILKIVEAGLKAIKTDTIIRNSISLKRDTLYIKNKKFSLRKFKNVYVVAVGKCSFDSIKPLEEKLGSRITGGIALDVKKSPKFKKIKGVQGTHPMPSAKNVEATLEIIKLLKNSSESDLLIFLISGGGSTLLCAPYEKSFEEEAKILQSLFEAGAPIREVNTIRKHISLARGGQLSKLAHPASIISLIFSDVPGDDLSFVASGPTIKDETTTKDAERILNKYKILQKAGLKECKLIETPKEDKYFKKTTNIILVSNKDALGAMSSEAKRQGFKSKICDYCLAGEARIVGGQIVEILNASPSKTALLYGGETTVTVKTRLKGGRSQELALSALEKIQEGEIIAAFASDGHDNTEFAGALCDIITLEKTKKAKLKPKQYLDRNNSFSFFEKIGDYILTGRTGSNVSDLVIAIKE